VAASLHIHRLAFVLEGDGSAMHRTVRPSSEVLDADRLTGPARLDEASLAAASYQELLRISGHELDVGLLATVAKGQDLEALAFGDAEPENDDVRVPDSSSAA